MSGPHDATRQPPSGGGEPLNPGDEAPPGTPGAGENVCRRCRGSGTLADGQDCPDCGGTGRVIEETAGG